MSRAPTKRRLNWAAIRIVAGREIYERLHSKLIWVITGITTVLIVAAIIVPAIVKSPAKPSQIGLVGAGAQSLAPALRAGAAHAGLVVHLRDIASTSTAAPLVTKGTLDVALVASGGGFLAEVKESIDPTLGAVIQSAATETHLEAVLSSGIPAATLRRALGPVPVTTKALHPPRPQQGARIAVAIAASVFLYVSLLTYGQTVAGGAAQEKTSRTAEVLLTTLSPVELLAGKVLGIGVTGLGQIVVNVGAGLIANAFARQAHISSILVVLLPGILVWFLLGYALYSFAYAAAGSLVSRAEEVQAVCAPFNILLVGGYLLIFLGVGNPGATWMTVASLFPPLSPVIMPARLALLSVPPWQSALAVALTLLATVATARLGARIYAASLIRSGPRVRWKAAMARPESSTSLQP